MPSLGIVPDCVSSPQSDPLWDWSILLLLSGQLLLDLEGLVRWHFDF